MFTMREDDDSSVPNIGSPSPGKTTPSSNPVQLIAGSCHKKKRKRISCDPIMTAVEDHNFDL
eukprot:4010648-Ditylum_brightwellii.AAC.1